MPKMIKGYNFVKHKTTKNAKSHAHLQIMMKHSAEFQVNLIKDVAGVAGTRYELARTITSSKMVKTKIRNQKSHAHLHMIRRQSKKFQISPIKDIRSCGTRSDGRKDGQTDRRTHVGTHGRTWAISIALLRLRRVKIMSIFFAYTLPI